MHRRRMVSLGIPLFSALLLLLPQMVSAAHPDRTVCNRQFLTLPDPLSDPFGYRHTEPLSIPGIGNQRRVVECDYIGGGGRFDGGGFEDGMRGGRVGPLRGPRIDYTAYIADLLRERAKERRKKAREERPAEPEVLVPPFAPCPEDRDRLPEAGEVLVGTDPCKGDTDDDGVDDGREVGGDVDRPYDQDGVLPIDALDPGSDSDCDGFDNLEELFLGTAPLDPSDPAVEEGVRKRTVSLDPRHPCYEAVGRVVMPRTGWESSWVIPAALAAGAMSFLTLLLVLRRGRG